MTRVLLCFGDSNTHGTAPMHGLHDLGRLGRDARWPRRMAQALGPGWEVIEEGHPGRTTVHDDPVEGPHRNGLRVLPAILESHRPIDLVLIKLGTNDMKFRFSVTAADVGLSLERLVREIRLSGCGPDGGAPDVLLIAPPPLVETGCLAGMFHGGAEKSTRLGPEIAAAAARAGVPFIDAGAHIAVSPLDGIHYDAEAHAVLAHALAEAVVSQFGE